MRAVIVLAVIVLLGVLAWQVGAMLSPDAISMALGLIFGVLAGVPAALLVLAAGGRRGHGDDYASGYEEGRRDAHREMLEHDARRALPPVVIVQAPAPSYTPSRPFQLPEQGA